MEIQVRQHLLAPDQISRFSLTPAERFGLQDDLHMYYNLAYKPGS